MSDWTSGYIADIGYTYGYYAELNPIRTKLTFLYAGLVPPEIATACELGYGQGLSANIHAAASGVAWSGTDFNPAQAGFARELTQASGADIKLSDQAFAEFASSDTPEFDFIGLHGIWSWISDENRAVIVDFVRRKLKLGGVLYVSYNTLPGWASFAPLRHLMVQHAELIGAEGHGIVNRINGALDFTEKLLATNPLYGRANATVADRFKRIKDQNRHYLAHEYFNRDWLPMHFATMAEWLAPAKVTYACSAHHLDHIEGINLTPDQNRYLREITSVELRESVRDFMVNQQFRRDYWVKGARRLSPIEQGEQLREQRIALLTTRQDVSLEITSPVGKVNGTPAIYDPVLDLLADHAPQSIGQLEQALQGKGVAFPQLLEAIMVLIGKGNVAPVQDEAATKKAQRATGKLNAHLVGKARGSGDISYIASPVTGGGVPVGRFAQLFIAAMKDGKSDADALAQHVWAVLRRQNQRLMKEGKPLESEEENLADLRVQATAFLEKQLRGLKALQIA